MKRLIKLCIGVDISKDDFHAYFAGHNLTDDIELKLGARKFDNSHSGIEAFQTWIDVKCETHADQIGKKAKPWIVLEATGVYHEHLAYDLYEAKRPVSVILPNTSFNFAKSLNEHSKTDRADSRILAQMGLERKLVQWLPFSEKSLQLKSLTRERQGLVDERICIKNQRHAVKCARNTLRQTVKRMNDRINFIDKQIGEIEDQIGELIKEDTKFTKAVDRLTTIPGFGRLTACLVLAETDGFTLFKTRNQLIKYCGLDVVYKQSGTSINARTHISKKGNKHIRGGLFMPALTARNHGIFKIHHDRQKQMHGKHKKSITATMRKMLIVAYAMIKNETDYNPQYERERLEQKPKKRAGQSEDQPAVTAPHLEGVLD